MSTLSLLKDPSEANGYCIKLSPPQTQEPPMITVGKGAYCFVIDVSGSMNAAANITTDDGDKVNHGWSQLDIAKHSTNTFVASLEDGDYVSIVTYSDGANVLLNWTECTSDGREKAIAAIHSMRPERSTNLMAGITTGFSQFECFPVADEELGQYALSLIITTDGMPSSQWHPARGRDGYFPLIKTLSKGLVAKRGTEAAKPVITSIGIGFQLDSELLSKMSQTFLHMPDPGQIGPFIVNLLAACRSTARLPDARGRAANHCALLITPASAVAMRPDGSGLRDVPGYGSDKVETVYTAAGAEAVKVALGTVLYDQARHVLVRTTGGEAFEVSLECGDATLLVAASADAAEPTDLQKKAVAYATMRLAATTALDQAVAAGTNGGGAPNIAVPLLSALSDIKGCPYAADPLFVALANTLEKECTLGAELENFRKWGAHYFRTLPCMLRTERRSNFRDECLQEFGKDERRREALFEEQSNAAEMRFATLAPPEPSLLRPYVPAGVPVAGSATPAVAAAPPRPVALPDEFMRGGGCFGPDATVGVVGADGSMRRVKVSAVRAGDCLVGEGGRLALVRCAVLTECAGGRAQLTRMPNGLELTEWHPVRDVRTGRWRFPIMLGERLYRTTPYVYNFVLEPHHPTIVVDGVPCAALGHGLTDDVVAHPYWGTAAVIADLQRRPGWEAGRVVLGATAA